MMKRNPSPVSAHRRLLSRGDDDPLGSVTNLFDVAMVFAAALLMALVIRLPMLELLSSEAEVTLLKNPGQPDMEIIRRDGETLEHYRLSDESIGGEGQRLGVAYRLQNGEVVYVPEADPPQP